jgi:hypothetical protein
MATNTTQICPICYEPFNRKRRSPVPCSRCHESFCQQCFAKTLLISPSPDLHCPGAKCMQVYDYEFLVRHFSANMVETLFHAQVDKMMQHELSLIPATLQQMEREKRVRMFNQRYGKLAKEYTATMRTLPPIRFRCLPTLAVLRLFRTQWQTFEENLEALTNEFADIQGENPNNNDTTTVVHHQHLLVRCPCDGCNGFVSPRKFVCKACKTRICRECHEVQQETHVCRAENVNSITRMKQDTRPCPNCAAPIYRISGCDQMFCTRCHTPFDYRTGTIIRSHFHNPHYVEWIRNGGTPSAENRGYDCECNYNYIDVYQFRFLVSSAKDELYNWIRTFLHIRGITRNRFYTEPLPVLFGIIRRQRIANKLNDHKWRIALRRTYRMFLKKRQLLDALTVFCEAATDIFISIRSRRIRNIQDQLLQLRTLFASAQERIAQIGSIYQCKPYWLGRDGFVMRKKIDDE